MVPKASTKLDYEIEIAFVIGTRARYVEEKNALSHIAGYCICNDISERNFQAERGGQWMKGKSAETFGPLGPWLATRDEIEDVQDLAMSLDVNGERRQTGNTKTMIFGIAHCLHYISQFMVLEAGRRGDDGHAARRRARHEAAEVAGPRRRHDAEDRRASASRRARSCPSRSDGRTDAGKEKPALARGRRGFSCRSVGRSVPQCSLPPLWAAATERGGAGLVEVLDLAVHAVPRRLVGPVHACRDHP